MPYVYGSDDNDITWFVFRGKPGKIYTIEMEFVEEGVLVRVK